MTRTKKPKPELTREQAWGFNDLMVVAAFRYCCGRQTYIVSVCANWLIEVWPMLSDHMRAVIKRDLEEEFVRDDQARASNESYKPLGWDCDRKEWERVRKLWEVK
jgi:hypothetical protein